MVDMKFISGSFLRPSPRVYRFSMYIFFVLAVSLYFRDAVQRIMRIDIYIFSFWVFFMYTNSKDGRVPPDHGSESLLHIPDLLPGAEGLTPRWWRHGRHLPIYVFKYITYLYLVFRTHGHGGWWRRQRGQKKTVFLKRE